MLKIAGFAGALALAGLLVAQPVAAEVSDTWITTKAKLALLTAEGVDGTDVNVDTVNGRVTLHGKVESAAEKTKAEQVAKGIDGVKSVGNLLQVVPKSEEKAVESSDDQIREAVVRALEEDPMLADSDPEVASVSKGVVLLRGEAESMSDQLQAVAAARAVPGVTRVVSEITGPGTMEEREIWRDDVRGSSKSAKQGDEAKADKAYGTGDKGTQSAKGESAKGTMESTKESAKDMGRSVGGVIQDAWITSDIKTRLIANDQVPALDVNVDTRKGVVTLFGMVPSDAAKAAAEADARKVDGVKSVENQLQVVADSRKEAVKESDDAIDKRIDGILADMPGNVEVKVTNGVVHLTGSVGSRSESMRVAQAVRGVAGVRAVHNELAVKPAMKDDAKPSS